MTAEQLEAFADGIEKYVPLGKGHITTRHNIQMHDVPLAAGAAKLIRELGDASLSSREGCEEANAPAPRTDRARPHGDHREFDRFFVRDERAMRLSARSPSAPAR